MDDQKVIDVLKGLVIDGVHRAQSGHPGGAMSSMDFAYVLFTEILRFDPDDPKWLGRDRFVLSAGHESMLLYSMLHMIGWLKVEDLQQFRQIGSRTPGHPENFMTPGVECTTGPLGQGAAMSVGMAIAARHLAGNLGDDGLFNQRIYSLLGDGCMQEDVTLGAASLAGHIKLRNLVWFYDKNRIQISGGIGRATSDDEEKIFSGFGWQVFEIDGHDRETIRSVLEQARAHADRPTLIVGNTTMAKGAANLEGSHETHGAPLSALERTATRTKLGLGEADFHLPAEILAHFRRNFPALRTGVSAWKQKLEQKKADAAFAGKFQHYFSPVDGAALPQVAFAPGSKIATRNAFGDLLKAWTDVLPKLVGGSADLEPSNMTEDFAKKVGDFHWDRPKGRNIAFGVREFPMSAVTNGIALFGGLIPFDATFLVFSDYARPALRLNALQRIPGIHEYTHDSFYLGEDGPTHQPIEHLMSLRAMPDMYVMRPADARETQVLFRLALTMDRPVCLCLSRQKLTVLDVPETTMAEAANGAYIVYESETGKNPEYLFLATGSEVELALTAAKELGAAGTAVRVVSMPCWELFDRQAESARAKILPSSCQKRISIEAGATLGWQKYIGMHGLAIGIDRFGESGKAEDLAKAFGFTVKDVLNRIRNHPFGSL